MIITPEYQLRPAASVSEKPQFPASCTAISGARYYEPTSGRFLSPDPLGHAASASLYDFANGDPINGFDPDGREYWHDVGSVANGYFIQGPKGVVVGAYNLVTSPVQTTQAIANGLGTLAGNLTYNTSATLNQIGQNYTNPNTAGRAIFNTVLVVTPVVEASIAKFGGGAADAADASVLSGHGAYDPASGTTVVPSNTSLTTWTAHGNTISDALGQAIETGSNISYNEFGSEITGAKTYLPGAEVPNYTLFPPDAAIDIMGNPTTVSIPTNFDALLSGNMGNVQWAACLTEIPGVLNGADSLSLLNAFNSQLPWWAPPAAGASGVIGKCPR